MGTIKELYDNGFSCKVALKYTSIFTIEENNLLTTENFIDLCDLEIVRKYGMRESRYTPECIRVAEIYVASWLDSHNYMINTLFNTETFKYNPIENYSSTIHEEIENTHNDNATKKNNTEYGMHTHDTGSEQEINDHYVTEYISALTETESTDEANRNNVISRNIGSKNTSNKIEVAPYDTGLKPKEYTNTVESEHSDTDNTIENGENKSKKEESSSNNRSTQDDASIDRKHEDESETNAIGKNSGTEESNGGFKTIRDYTQAGNVGVTTSQQMLQSEREIAMFSAIDIVTHYIIDIIASTVYGGV